jgi:hypothetical protein
MKGEKSAALPVRNFGISEWHAGRVRQELSKRDVDRVHEVSRAEAETDWANALSHFC